MRKSTRTLLAAALVLGVAAGPALTPAFAASQPAATAEASTPDLSAVIAGLPGPTRRPRWSGSAAPRVPGRAAPASTTWSRTPRRTRPPASGRGR